MNEPLKEPLPLAKRKITALIPTFNNDFFLSKTLDSIRWVDEILIVDSYSTDGTLEIAKKYGARVIQKYYRNSATQKNWALDFINTEWVFQIDSDEILQSGAEEEIRSLIGQLYSFDCYRVPRKNHMLGQWVQHGGLYPDWENRLFRVSKGEWIDREVHANFAIKGEYGYLKSCILHYGMPNISKQLKNLDRYTRYEAEEMQKKKLSFSWIKWLFFPMFIFLYRYIWLKGFLDGWRGFFLAVYSAFYYFLSHSKLKEATVLEFIENDLL